MQHHAVCVCYGIYAPVLPHSQLDYDEYCIVLYFNICIALLVGQTVQKRCHCARPHENKKVLRKTNEDERLPERKVVH